MKTPIQELIETIKKLQKDDDVQPFMWHEQIIKLAESMLEKEKEVMCGFGENVRGAMLKSDKHRTTEEVYNETFKTKEK